ncbi:hypothetical protein BKE38_08745 [Pseudoroseomonas deserti]|uniref:Baseplate assembly protein n=1 Tax=Teichococcus deserti TaxID=1817963 RepID=A0A1V2H402_9PROT|nr:hypothetical protein [Pseudoroseomonas deserti]ONG55745.1 hypothetical protein BKE38_08745 [Pseudoroseomonas deserti]
MNQLMNMYAAQAGQIMRQLGQPKWGIVESYNPERNTAKVRIQPDNILSGWLHVGTPAVADLEIIIPPIVGTMALVLLQEGDAQGLSGTLVASGFNDEFMPSKMPSAIGSDGTYLVPGELGVFQKNTGSCMRLSQTGKWFFKGDIEHDGNFTSSGNTRVMGNIKGDKEVIDKDGALDTLRDHYNAHRHTNVQTGGGTSGPTNLSDP